MLYMALSIFLPKSTQYRFWIAFMVLSLFGQVLYAADYYSNPAGNTGNFNAANVWAPIAGGTVAAFPANPNLHTFHIMSGDNITLSAAQTAGVIIVESGGFLINGGTFTLTCPTLTIDAGGTLNIVATRFTTTGSWTNNGSITLTSGRLTYSTGAGINNGSIVYTATGGRLEKTTGTLTNGAAGTISITGTATVTLSTGNFINNNIPIDGSYSVNFGSSAISISGTPNQSLGSFKTTGGFATSKSGGTLTLTGNVSAAAFTKSGNGVINMGTGLTHIFSGTFALGSVANSVNGGTNTIINLTAATALSGTGTVFALGTSTVVFGRAGNQTTSTTDISYYKLTFSGSGTKTMGAVYNVYNTFSLEGTATAVTAPVYQTGSGLRYHTTNDRNAGIEWVTPFAQSLGVTIDTMEIAITGARVFNSGIPLTIGTDGKFKPDAQSVTLGGNLINNGTWTASTGPVIIGPGTGTQSIGRINTSTVTGIISMTKTGGTATFTGDINGGGLTLNGSGGTLNLGATPREHTFSSWTFTNGTLQGNTSTLNIGGTTTYTAGTFTPNTGTVIFNGAGDQNIHNFSYANMQTATGGIKTLAGNTIVTGVLDIGASSTLNISDKQLTLSGAGTPLDKDVAGFFTAASSSKVIYFTGVQIISPLNYFNLDCPAGAKTLPAGTIGIAGTFNPTGGTYTVDSGNTINFNGGAQSIPTFPYKRVIISGSLTKSITTIVTVLDIEVQDGPTLDINTDGAGRLVVTTP